jgi:hypothetical protein
MCDNRPHEGASDQRSFPADESGESGPANHRGDHEFGATDRTNECRDAFVIHLRNGTTSGRAEVKSVFVGDVSVAFVLARNAEIINPA